MKAFVYVSLILVGCLESEKDVNETDSGESDTAFIEDTGQNDSGSPDIDTADTQDTSDTVDTGPVDGSQVAKDFCNNCHVWNSPVWGGDVPEFHTVIAGLSETELADIIRNGTSGGMPSFPNFSQRELDALIVYLMETYN